MVGQSSFSKEFLLKKTQQFELESIHTLILENEGVYDMGCLGDCLGLIRLNLSGNKISRLTTLRPLKQLQFLDLSRNRLSSLSGLEGLEQLRMLNLAGNLINSVDIFYPLANCESLEYLRLEDTADGLSNPVCDSNKNYKDQLKHILPGLKLLNGEYVTGDDSGFLFQCNKFEGTLKDATARQRSHPDYKASTAPILDGIDLTWQSAEVEKAFRRCKDTMSQFRDAENHAENVLQRYGSS